MTLSDAETLDLNKPGRAPDEPWMRIEPLLDSDEAAAFLKIHPKTLVRKAREGRIPAHRVGKGWRVHKSELDHWLDEPGQVVESSRQSSRVHGAHHVSKHS
jgi:excisionase family DNA binding protein